MAEPICQFKDNKELDEIMKEWKNRLYLDNWIIETELVEKNTDYEGQNEFIYEHMTSYIQINTIDRQKNTLMTHCEEKILVHELLHLKYNWIEQDSKYEGVYVDEKEHQLLEQMAKTLIIVKYNLDKDWFSQVKKYS